MTLKIREAIAALVFAGLVSCSVTPDQSNREESTSPVVASANGSALTLEELENMIPPEYSEYYSLEDRKALINRWVQTELIYQEAIKKGIDQEPDIQSKVDEFQRLLLENEILNREMGAKVSVTNEEIEAYYHENSDFFLRENDEVRISQIVVDSLGVAADLVERLRGDPSLFASLAREYSLDKNGRSDGDVGYYAIDELIDPLRKAVLSLKVGKTSPVVSVPGYGHFIVTVTDRKGRGTMKDLEDVESEIRDILLVNKEEEERQKWMEGLVARNEVDINWQIIEERYGD